MPVGLHAVPQLHPQLGLVLRRHLLPSLLDAGQGGIANRMFVAPLRLARWTGGQACGWSPNSIGMQRRRDRTAMAGSQDPRA